MSFMTVLILARTHPMASELNRKCAPPAENSARCPRVLPSSPPSPVIKPVHSLVAPAIGHSPRADHVIGGDGIGSGVVRGDGGAIHLGPIVIAGDRAAFTAWPITSPA